MAFILGPARTHVKVLATGVRRMEKKLRIPPVVCYANASRKGKTACCRQPAAFGPQKSPAETVGRVEIEVLTLLSCPAPS